MVMAGSNGQINLLDQTGVFLLGNKLPLLFFNKDLKCIWEGKVSTCISRFIHPVWSQSWVELVLYSCATSVTWVLEQVANVSTIVDGKQFKVIIDQEEEEEAVSECNSIAWFTRTSTMELEELCLFPQDPFTLPAESSLSIFNDITSPTKQQV